jgi:hypothetical protein
MYLFSLTTGKKKLAYGTDPEDALEVLSFRLTEAEMALVIRDEWIRISHREIGKYADQLG